MFLTTLWLEWAARLGWVLVHFLWQGAVIGALAVVLHRALRGNSPQTRYAVLCVALGLCVLAPCVTWFALPGASHPVVTERAVPATSGTHPAPGASPQVPASTVAQSNAAQVQPVEELVLVPESSSAVPIAARIDRAVPWIAAGWGLGVLLLSLRLLAGLFELRRLCRSGAPVVQPKWRECLGLLMGRLGIRRAIHLLESAQVDVPTVIGWLKPTIIVPLAFFATLSPAQAEAILAHELAHIRRHDYLVNLFQVVVETLLFYHPAVWWISRAIRQEREHCCDDLALAAVQDRVVYLEALATLEESRSTLLGLNLAASGGSLLERIRRLAGGGESAGGRRRGSWLWLGLVGGIAVVALGAIFAFHVLQVARENRERDDRLIAALEKGAGWRSNDFRNELMRSRDRANKAFDRDGKSLLDLAAERGFGDEALLLLLSGADPNLKDRRGRTPIYYALENPNDAKASVRDVLLLRGAKLDVTDNNLISPLMTAVQSADAMNVTMLLRWGANPHPAGAEGTLLQQVAQKRNDPKITALLQNYKPGPTKESLKHEITSQDIQDQFVAAANHGELDRMATLLGEGATVDGRARDGVPAIHRAIALQQEDALVYLLQLGADPSIRDDRSYPPLSWTFGWFGPTSDYMRLVLLAAGARADMVQDSGYNLLCDACSHQNEHGAQWMIWMGVDPTKACLAGTPMYIASKDGLDNSIKLLKRNGVTEAPFNNPDPKWQMLRAIKAGDIGRIQQLLDKGIPADLPLTDGGEDGLMQAIAVRQLDVARFLLQHGANPNYQDNSGGTPLHVSVGWHFPEMEVFREQLLQAGADPNLPDHGGRTPFISACTYGDLAPKITQMLAYGANINYVDPQGHTALYYAEHSGRTEAADYLRAHGAVDAVDTFLIGQVVDESGKGVANVQVQDLDGTSSVPTDAQGTFAFPNKFPASPRHVLFASTGTALGWASFFNVAPSLVNGGPVAETIVLEPRDQVLSGTVVDTKGNPVPNATVVPISLSKEVPPGSPQLKPRGLSYQESESAFWNAVTARTDGTGRFELPLPQNIRATLKISASGYGTLNVFPTQPPPVPDLGTLSLPDGGDIDGTVIDAATGKGLPKVIVRLIPPKEVRNSIGLNNGQTNFQGQRPPSINRVEANFQVVTTGDDGKFQFKSVPVGSYGFKVLRVGMSDLVLGGVDSAEVKPAQVLPVTLPLVKGQRVTGRVLAGSSDRLANHPYQINVTPGPDGKNSFWSQEYGTFVTYLAPGTYKFQVPGGAGTGEKDGPVQEVVVDAHNPTPPVTLRTGDVETPGPKPESR